VGGRARVWAEGMNLVAALYNPIKRETCGAVDRASQGFIVNNLEFCVCINNSLKQEDFMTIRYSGFFAFSLVLGGLLAFGTADAKNEGKLPKAAVPLTAEETKALFSGSTINWGDAQAYWAPDGTSIGYYHKGKVKSFAEGTWTVNGNEMCYDNGWRDADKTKPVFNDNRCAKYYKVKKVIWTENTKDEDKWMGDIWTGINKKLKKGDLVSAKATALKAKFGY
jgi:Protein of unknown function (DUF995)